MPLERVLEPEVMDEPDEALDYDRMDHRQVNQRFVDDLLAAVTDGGRRLDAPFGELLDLGTGTAQIPIALCRAAPGARVVGVDLAVAMLELAKRNVAAAGLEGAIRLERLDAKGMPYPDERFAGVISNSIVHHIPEPGEVLAEAARIVRPGGLLFFRDLLRPLDEETLARLVAEYAGGDTPRQRGLFEQSLRAALSLDEVRDLVAALGFDRSGVAATSDRHWTWTAWKG